MEIADSGGSSGMSTHLNSNKEAEGVVLNDVDLNQWLTQALANKHTIVIAYANHLCKVIDETIPDAPLLVVDPDKESSKILKRLTKAGLLKQVELTIDELSQAITFNPSWKAIGASQTDVTNLLKKRNRLFGQGRVSADLNPQLFAAE